MKKFISDNVTENNVTNAVETLYNNGYSGKDLEDFINRDKKLDSTKKCKLIIYLSKITKEIRDEKIILTSTLNNIFFRSNIDLENIMLIKEMDDYHTDSLYESRNEWMARFVNTLIPHLNEGVVSIFKEAYKLCQDNDETEKYLMTFQNLLSRVPSWNQTIIDNETTRIIDSSRCGYLNDLLTCVHVIQLKTLTNVRVCRNQKKIDIDIPKLIFLSIKHTSISLENCIRIFIF